MQPDGSVVYTAAGSELTNSRKKSSPSIRGSAARAMRSKTSESKGLTFPNLISSVMAATQSQPSPRKGPKDQTYEECTSCQPTAAPCVGNATLRKSGITGGSTIGLSATDAWAQGRCR